LAVLAGEKASDTAACALIRSSEEAVEGTMLACHLAFGIPVATWALTSVDESSRFPLARTLFFLDIGPSPPFGQGAKGPMVFYSPIAEVIVEQ
jgi:hypothetical protein